MTTRVAIYIRVSTEEQDIKGVSIPAQEEVLTKFIKDNGYVFNKEKHTFIDKGISGAKEDREALNELMYCAEKGEFDLLLVWKVDRFFRRTLSLLEYVEYLNDYGVLFKSITQEFATDTSSGKMILGVFGILAELERDMIRERTSMGKLRKAKEGYYVGGGKPALGFKFIKEGKGTKLQIIEEEQKLVNTIFELYVNEKKSLGEISKILERDNVLTKADRIQLEGGKSKKIRTGIWHSTSISKILKNTIYIGEYYYGKNERVRDKKTKKEIIRPAPKDKVITLNCPIILNDISLYSKAQELLIKNSLTKNNKKNHVFAGLIKCDHCGSSYVGYRTSKKTMNYRCKSKMTGTKIQKEEKCINHEAPERYLIDTCWKYIYEVFKSPDKAIEKYYEEKGKNSNLDRYIKKVKDLKEKKDQYDLAIKKAYKKELLTIDIDEAKLIKETLEELETEKQAILISIVELNKKVSSIKDRLAHLNNLHQLKAFYEKKIESISEEKKIEIIKELVEIIKIEVSGNVRILFKFQKSDDDEDIDDGKWNRPEKPTPTFLDPTFGVSNNLDAVNDATIFKKQNL